MNKILKSIFPLLILSSIVSCTSPDNSNKNTGEDTPIVNEGDPICTKTVTSLLEGTVYETPVYTFTSDTEGPRVAIVGGIHGDEIAGWMACEQLIQRTNYKGTVMIIPYANILADFARQRYLGIGNSGKITTTYYSRLLEADLIKDRENLESIKSIKYTDLNRIFPGDSNGTDTAKIAKALYDCIIDFAPNYLVDLHESRHNNTVSKAGSDSSYLGSSIIPGNSYGGKNANIMVGLYNEKYADVIDGTNYTQFTYIDGLTDCSDVGYNQRFCQILGEALHDSKCRVMTFETNRNALNNLYNTTDGRNVDYRITEQLRLVDLLFDRAYTEYNEGKFKNV